jgi:hypothetical protein
MTATVDEYRHLSAASMREDELQTAVISIARSLGYLVAHFRPARVAGSWRTPTQADANGYPDLTLARDGWEWKPGYERGRLIFVELKSQRGRVGQFQELWLDVLRACGCECYVWRPSDLISGEIAEILTGPRPVTVDDVRGIAPDMTVNPWEDEG